MLASGFLHCSVVNNLLTNSGNMGLIHGSEGCPGKRNENTLQYSCLEKSYGQRNLVGYSSWRLKRVGQDLVTKLCLPHGRNCKVFSFGLNHGMPRYLVKHFGGVSVCSMFLDKSCVRICLLIKAVVLLSVGVVHPTSWQPENNKNVEERKIASFCLVVWIGPSTPSYTQCSCFSGTQI